MTGRELTERILEEKHIANYRIEPHKKHNQLRYQGNTMIIRLTEPDESTSDSLFTAAHEAGHAMYYHNKLHVYRRYRDIALISGCLGTAYGILRVAGQFWPAVMVSIVFIPFLYMFSKWYEVDEKIADDNAEKWVVDHQEELGISDHDLGTERAKNRKYLREWVLIFRYLMPAAVVASWFHH